MDTLLKFKLELDAMTAGATVKDLGINTHGVFTGIDRDIAQVQRHMESLGREIKIRIDTSAITKANDQMTALTQAGAMAAGSLAAQGISRGLDFAKGQITDILKSGMEAGATKMQFDVLAGKGAGGALYNDLGKFIKDSIFGPELYGEAKTMMAYGVKPDNVVPVMKMLGDVSMGDPQRLHSLGYAYAQTMSYGHLRGNEMLQYGDAGFNPSRVIGEMLHKNSTEMEKLISEGKISADMVTKAFEHVTGQGGQFHGMLDAMADTPQGKYLAAMGNIDKQKQDFGLALMPEVSKFLDDIKPVLEQLPATLHEMEPALVGAIHGLADLVKWTSAHTETIGTWVRLAKVAAEAWAVWKVGTVALTAANWLWMESVGAQVTETAALTGAVSAENVALAEQAGLVQALALEYDQLIVSISGMTLAERAAFEATALNSAGLPIAMGGAVAGAGAGKAALAGGLMANASSLVVPVFIAGAAAGVADAMGWAKWKDGLDMFIPDALGIEFSDRPYFQEMRRQEAAERARRNLQRNPQEYANGWGMNDMLGLGADKYSGAILDKYGVKNPTYSKSMAGGPSTSAESTDAITGGGRKQIIIHARFGEHMVNNFHNTDAGVETVRGQFERMFLSVLQSANAAM